MLTEISLPETTYDCFAKDIGATTVKGYLQSDNPVISSRVPKEEYHKFDINFSRVILGHWANSLKSALFAYGLPGSGKTSTIKQIAARLKIPVFEETLAGSFQFLNIVGNMGLVADKAGDIPRHSFLYGPLPRAMKYGGWLILNEFDIGNPEEVIALNDIIEGAPLEIQENGAELVVAHPNFRIFLTANTNGNGDQEGKFAGTQIQNSAILSRCRFFPVKYFSAQEEIELLDSAYPRLGKEIIEKIVQVANQIRDGYLKGELPQTLTLRALRRWCGITIQYTGSMKISPVELGFREAFLYGQDEVVKPRIEIIARNKFGSIWKGLSEN